MNDPAKGVTSVKIRGADAEYFHSSDGGTQYTVPVNPSSEGIEQWNSIFKY